MKLISVSLLLLLFFSCQNDKASLPSDSDENQNSTLANQENHWQTYYGVLPCADCSGIETTLSLESLQNKYILQQNYLGKKDGLFETTGTFTIDSKTNHQEGKIIQLAIEGRNGMNTLQFFQTTTAPNLLHHLSQTGDIIESDLDYTLSLREEAPLN